MLLPLPPHPNPILRKRSRDLDMTKLCAGAYDDFFSDLKETMLKAPGVGIAAVQVGKLLRVFFVETEVYKGIFINPKIVSASDETADEEEGCLSIPGTWGIVSRTTRLKIEAFNARGIPFTLKASGILARVIQHETDHLNGKLFIDRAKKTYERTATGKPTG